MLFIIYFAMMNSFIKDCITKIEGKTYLQPKFDIEKYEHFFLPKLQLKGTQHVYFNTDDIMELYKQKNIDPNNLQCNLKYDPSNDVNNHKIQAKTKEKEQVKRQVASELIGEQKMEKPLILLNKRPRPPLREKGFTHFIHIPFVESCRQAYQNIIKTQIDPNDLDILVNLNTLHATIMVFRLHSSEDLPKWQKILRSIKLKKVKVTLRGVGIFPVKPNTNYTRVFFIKVNGLQELIHDIVSKAITQGVVTEKQLSHIVFDKKTDMYQAEQHLTLLKTKNEKDFIDAGPYLRMFGKLNIGKVPVTDIRLSHIGSFDGQSYYDEVVVPSDK